MDAVMAATNDVNDEKEEEDEEQFRELERMQSMTHEDIVEKIMQLRTTRLCRSLLLRKRLRTG